MSQPEINHHRGDPAAVPEAANAGHAIEVRDLRKSFGHQLVLAGVTLDFPAGRRSFALLQALDAIVDQAGGRVYLAKDACSTADRLRHGYPAIERFLAVREAVDPGRKFTSLQSQRLGL